MRITADVLPPSSPARRAARWAGRAVVLSGVGAGLWLAGGATASADTGTDGGTAAAVVGVVPQVLDAVPQGVDPVPQVLDVVPRVVDVVPATADAVVQPVVGRPVVVPIVDAVTTRTASAALDVVDAVETTVARGTQPLRPVGEATSPILLPAGDGVPAPATDAQPAAAPSSAVVAIPLPSAAEVEAADAAPPASVRATGASVEAPSAAPSAPAQPADPAPAAPVGPARTAPASAAGSAGGGSDGGSADVPDNTPRAALRAAGTAHEPARRGVGTAAFDPSFTPD